jgi:hypothetical protein
MAKPYHGAWRVIANQTAEFSQHAAHIGEIARLRAQLRFHAERASMQILGRNAPAIVTLKAGSDAKAKESALAAIKKSCDRATFERFNDLRELVVMADARATLVIEGLWALPATGKIPEGSVILVENRSLGVWIGSVIRSQSLLPVEKVPANAGGVKVSAFEFDKQDFADLIRLLQTLIGETAGFSKELEQARNFVCRLRSAVMPAQAARPPG